MADQSAELLNLLSATLSSKCFECLVTKDGKDAFFKCLETGASIVILGFGIAEDADGIKAAREILLNRPRTEVIILVNKKSKITKKEESIGVELFIERSTNLEKIVNAICGLCNLRKSPSNLVAR
jgi:DNA-binding response OmpR family regulator